MSLSVKPPAGCELDGEEEIFALTSSSPGYKRGWGGTGVSQSQVEVGEEQAPEG